MSCMAVANVIMLHICFEHSYIMLHDVWVARGMDIVIVIVIVSPRKRTSANSDYQWCETRFLYYRTM